MPFVRISVSGPAPTPSQIERLHAGATDLMTSVMRKPLDGVAVLVETVAGGWSIAGRPVPVAAHVEATVAAHSTTAEENARFVSAMWRLLRATLGPELREETYVVIRDTDPAAYGRGGLTRAERDRRAATPA